MNNILIHCLQSIDKLKAMISEAEEKLKNSRFILLFIIVKLY